MPASEITHPAADEIAQILGATTALAAEQGWADVTSFTDALPEPADPTLLLLPSIGTDGEPLWLWAQAAGLQVTGGELEPLATDPGPALAANRVVVVLQCGHLLTPEAVAATAVVVRRPPTSFKIALVGAEVLREPTDLHIVERSVWRLLVGAPDEDGTGADLAERGCLLWSDGAVAGFLAARVERDRERLASWAASPVPDVMGPERAVHALTLAERADESRRTRQASREERRLADTRGAVAEGGRRLLKRMDADLATYERQITASLQMLEQDLLSGIGPHIARHRDELSGRRATTIVGDYIDQGVARWRRSTATSFATRIEQINRETADLLDDIDWQFVNAVAPHPSGRPYPGVMVEELRLDPPARAVELDPRSAAEPSFTPRERPSEIPLTVAGGAITGAIAVALGSGIVPAAVLGALGATGGHLVGRYLYGGQAEQEVAAHARELITSSMAMIRKAVTEKVRDSLTSARQLVGGHFDLLDQALGAATAVSAPADDAVTTRLRELRHRLTAALA